MLFYNEKKASLRPNSKNKQDVFVDKKKIEKVSAPLIRNVFLYDPLISSSKEPTDM